MRTLAAQGRQTEALRAYQEYRHYLGEEIGTEPSSELRDLEARIAAGWHDAPEPAGTEAPAPPRTNLPALLTSFVGRSADVERLTEVLAEHRLVTLVGPGGIGKTRLALQTAAQLVGRYGDGIWLVELGPLDDPADVAQMTASVVGVRSAGGRGLVADVVAWLRSQRVLVVLDNCEHVVDAAGELAAALVAGCPQVSVLATSREGPRRRRRAGVAGGAARRGRSCGHAVRRPGP